MKNLLILLALSGLAWQFYFKDSAIVETASKKAISEFSNNDAINIFSETKEIIKPKVIYKCDGREHCSQMKSYDEAKYFNRYCPNTKMDGDHDGIPCERQFNK